MSEVLAITLCMLRLIIAVVLFCSSPLSVAASPVPVKLADITNSKVNYEISSYGVLAPNTEELSFQIPGRIEEFLAEEGDRVTRDQLLAVLETKDAEDALRAASVSLDQAERRLERMQTLHTDGSIGQSALEDAADVFKQSEIAHERAKLNLERCELRAPESGVILEEVTDSRTSVIAGQPIFSYRSDLEAWKVEVGLIDSHAFTFREGSNAKVSFAPYGRQAFDGKVIRLGRIADNATGLFTAEIAVNVGDRELRPGMVAEVFLYEESSRAFASIPLDALTELKRGSATIYVMSPGTQRVEKKQVSIEAIQGQRVYLKDDLSAYQRVVLRGQTRLSDQREIVEIP